MAKDRAKDPKRMYTRPTVIGMGALVGYGDFDRAAERKKHRDAEEAIIDKTPSIDEGNRLVQEYRKKHNY